MGVQAPVKLYLTLPQIIIFFSWNVSFGFGFGLRSSFISEEKPVKICNHKIEGNIISGRSGVTSLFGQIMNKEDETAVTKIQIPSFAPLDQDGPAYPSPLHTIHVHSQFLSSDQAGVCLKLARDYAEETSCWENVDQVRHVNYRTADFSLLDEECPELMDYLNQIGFHEKIFTRLSQAFGLITDDDEEHYMTYLDLFCVNYQASGANDESIDEYDVLDRLEPHRDGSLFSFTVLLSCPESDFSGGGTFFDALQNLDDKIDTNNLVSKEGVLRPHHAGDAVLHTGKTLHGAEATTNGQRTVLVGFVDLQQNQQGRFIRSGALRDACRDWGRLDVSLWRTKRHLELSDKKQNHKSFYNPAKYRHQAWLTPKHLNGSKKTPTVHKRRIDAAYQRCERLKVEDTLLRNILLSHEERKQILLELPSFGSKDITFL